MYIIKDNGSRRPYYVYEISDEGEILSYISSRTSAKKFESLEEADATLDKHPHKIRDHLVVKV